MIRLLIIAPELLDASLLAEVLSREHGFAILGMLTSGQALDSHSRVVDVVALHADPDISDPIAAIRQLRRQLPDARIVLVRAPGGRDIRIGALEAGASGVVGQDETVADIVAAIRSAHLRGPAIEPDLATLLIDCVTALHGQGAGQARAGSRPFAALSAREWEVLKLVSEDLSNADIAERLFITVGTVKNHIHKILTKLDAGNRGRAADWYRWQQLHGEAGPATTGSTSGAGHGGDTSLPASRLPTTRTMIQERLATFCTTLGWPAGHIFLRDSMTGELGSTDIWYLRDPVTAASFRDQTARLRIGPREGALGRILTNPAPVRIENLDEWDDDPRAAAAREVGFRSALFLPFVDGTLAGVFEFYATDQEQPSPDTIASAMHAGRRIIEQLELSR